MYTTWKSRWRSPLPLVLVYNGPGNKSPPNLGVATSPSTFTMNGVSPIKNAGLHPRLDSELASAQGGETLSTVEPIDLPTESKGRPHGHPLRPAKGGHEVLDPGNLSKLSIYLHQV